MSRTPDAELRDAINQVMTLRKIETEDAQNKADEQRRHLAAIAESSRTQSGAHPEAADVADLCFVQLNTGGGAFETTWRYEVCIESHNCPLLGALRWRYTQRGALPSHR